MMVYTGRGAGGRGAARGAEMHVDKYCFRAPYVAALLRRGLGLHDDAPYHVEAGNVAWTLGASLPLAF